MDIFSLSPAGEYLNACLKPHHEKYFFRLSTLIAGNLSVKKKRERESFLYMIGIPYERVAYFTQTHSTLVATVSPNTRSPIRADGGITIDPKVVLSITAGDCLPVALFDTAGPGYALVHSGWRGTGIAVNALTGMSLNFGTKPEDVLAIIGPGIGSCCYNVPEERADKFRRFGDGVVFRRKGETFLDLKEANRVLLKKAGIGEIRVSSLCTCCADNLGSFRREGAGKFTTMLAVAGHI